MMEETIFLFYSSGNEDTISKGSTILKFMKSIYMMIIMLRMTTSIIQRRKLRRVQDYPRNEKNHQELSLQSSKAQRAGKLRSPILHAHSL